MKLNDVTISRLIIESYTRKLTSLLEVDVAMVGAGPANMTAGYYLGKAGLRAVIFESKLAPGGGMWGGGMMFPRIVVQDEGKEILDKFGIRSDKYEAGYWTADSIESVSTICSKTVKAGARIFNLISVEDVMIREKGVVEGLVLNWSAVEMAKLHVDPLTIKADMVIDATGHDCEVVNVLLRKMGNVLNTPTGGIMGEKPMWAEAAEESVVNNTVEVYPGLVVAGMSANAVMGSPRMGPIFGGMLLSGRAAAKLIAGKLG